MRTPTKPITANIVNEFLSIRKKVLKVHKNSHEDELLYSIFDMKIAPITFNIVDFLIVSEYEASQRGKKGFVIVFVPEWNPLSNEWGDYDSLYDSDYKVWAFHNIVLASTLLAPKCKGIYILPRRSDISTFIEKKNVIPDLYDGVNLRYLDMKDLYRKLNQPHLVEGLRATKQGLRYIENWHSANEIDNPVVSITIRKSEFDKARNSNIEAWVKFAHYLQNSDYFPVVVPDTENTFCTADSFSGLHVFNECSWNAGLRMALYESSYLNFFTPNGPASFAVWNARCSYIIMNRLPKNSIVATEEFLEREGAPINENYKFALPNQRLVFKRDSYENIVAEFERFVDDDIIEKSS